MAVYIDTSAWVALLDAKDRHHEDALEAKRRLAATGVALVTGWHTLVELADGLVHHVSQGESTRVLRRILESPSVRVDPTEPYMERAVAIFETREDWNVDLSDCLSFALMESEGIQRAFTYDRDFEKPGFDVIG